MAMETQKNKEIEMGMEMDYPGRTWTSSNENRREYEAGRKEEWTTQEEPRLHPEGNNKKRE